MNKLSVSAAAGVLAFGLLTVCAGAVQQTNWPKTFDQNGTKIVVYQPQVTSWPNYTVLNGLAAVAVTKNGSSQPIYGVVHFRTYTSADFQTGQVALVETKITSSKWPNESPAVSASLSAAVDQIPLKDNTVPLATILASLDASKALPKPAPLNHAPPTIYYTEKNAILVVFDRDPILAPIAGTDLKFAVNTNWAVIFDGADSKYYLLDGDRWIAATSYTGPWGPATAPPEFAKIPNDPNWQEVHANLGAAAPSAADVPEVFVSTTPADLIAIAGKPVLSAIDGAPHLSYVSNTGSNVFFYEPAKEWYVLLSGRWYRSDSLSTGPWTYASTSLPAAFSQIPVNSPRGGVLVSVPGTAASQYVGASTAVPQVAQVSVSNSKIDVIYSGSPQFEPIAGTSLSYAVNTSFDVIRVTDGQYFACYSGVWFTAPGPSGPWSVATYVPKAIYTIPPSSPLYADTYVYVYDDAGAVVTAPPVNPAGAAVLVGFTAGYLSGYWDNGWVYGTGYYWPGYYAPGAFPVYYPYAATWTGGSWYTGAAWGTAGSYYNSRTGYYGNQASIYGPYGGATARAAYNPATGTYARGGAVYGPNGGVAAGGSFYNSRYGVSGSTYQERTPYGSWGASAVHTQYGNAYGAHASGAYGEAAGVATRYGTSAVAKGANGDVYAGHDGNVYRNQDGSWQKSTGGGNWSNVQSPSSYHPSSSGASAYHPSGDSDLDRDFDARGAGASGFHGFSDGGGFRGGGGFRR